MGYSWDRNGGSTGTTLGKLSVIVGTTPPAASIRRVIFGWNLYVTAPMWAYDRLVGRPVYAGAHTIRSGFAGTIPDPAISPVTEVDYPGERWLWWEACELAGDGPVDYVDSDRNVTLRTPGTLTPRDFENSVKNTYAGQDLFTFVTISCPDLVNVGLEGRGTAYGSTLYSS